MKNNIKILHIEDDISDAIMVRQLLKKMTTNGELSEINNVVKLSEGLKELRDNVYDVVLLDLGLADVSGLDNLRCIKEENPEIPIIVLTGNDNDKLARDALMEGAQEYLFKGQSSAEILKRVIHSSILRKAAENELNRQLHYDDLTKLPNRILFKKLVTTLISKAKRRGISEAMIFMDLDGFKAVNDTYGHEAGNKILQVTADRMQSTIRKSDVLARYAGDEFILYIDGTDEGINEEDCIKVSQKLLAAVEEPIEFDGQMINISLSIGISFFPKNAGTFSSLIETADEAMYVAKKSKTQRYSFSNTTNNTSEAVYAH